MADAIAGSKVHVPAGRGGLAQSVHDSFVVARRNLIRMTRIPNPLRPVGFRSISPGARNLHVSGPEAAR
jgi:hypothetical protein